MLHDRTGPAFDGGGLGAAALLAALVIWWHPNARLPAAPAPQAPPVQLSVVEAPPAPPVSPAPPPPAPPEDAPPPLPLQPVLPTPLPTPAPRPPLRAKPRHRPTPPSPPAAEVQAQPAPAAAFDLPRVAAPVRDARAEDSYVAGLHAYLLGRTAPPDTPAYRLLRPAGTADIGFALTRSGAVLNVHVLRSAGSALLDRQALSIVQAGRYPAIPTQAFAGEAEHSFHILMEFRPTASDQ